VLVKLLEAMKLKVLLAAPTGRAAQRMMDVIGRESKTIHRLLEWQIGKFNKKESTMRS
jgi:exodeoxyribonuclease V alpha subunit